MIIFVQNYIDIYTYGVKVTHQGIFKENLGELKCAVCPECGYTETYVQDTSKIKKLVLNNK